ncbi:hypothetical protein PSHT_13631 [Puccinia striiformis]|uniref:Uncharacterized protein n=1 Tax=Puccinia striiformis TaxID=27350 RepID=A0A2S4UPI6_9BASI|nr:hypothetical protein PSHT_13631 [Puccinia striiformis]
MEEEFKGPIGGADTTKCTGSLWATMGIPCWHMLDEIFAKEDEVTPSHFHLQWNLRYHPDKPDEEEDYDFDADFNTLKEELLANHPPAALERVMRKIRQVVDNTHVVPMAPVIDTIRTSSRKEPKRRKKLGRGQVQKRDAIYAEIVDGEIQQAQDAKEKATEDTSASLSGSSDSEASADEDGSSNPDEAPCASHMNPQDDLAADDSQVDTVETLYWIALMHPCPWGRGCGTSAMEGGGHMHGQALRRQTPKKRKAVPEPVRMPKLETSCCQHGSRNMLNQRMMLLAMETAASGVWPKRWHQNNRKARMPNRMGGFKSAPILYKNYMRTKHTGRVVLVALLRSRELLNPSPWILRPHLSPLASG